jgi:hypothetical protein
MLSHCLLFEWNLAIVGEVIVVGVFVVIAVNTMMANFDVMVSALADTEVSAFMCAVLTHVCCLRW